MFKRLFGNSPDSSDLQERADAIAREEARARANRRDDDDEEEGGWGSAFDQDTNFDAAPADEFAPVADPGDGATAQIASAPAAARLEAVQRAWDRLQPESRAEIASRLNRSERDAQVALADALRSREQVWEAVQGLLGGETGESVSMFQIMRDRHLRALVAALLPELGVLQQMEGR